MLRPGTYVQQPMLRNYFNLFIIQVMT